MSITEDLRLEVEEAPAIIRAGGRGGGQPHEWEKLIGPVISQNIGKDVLVQVFPKDGLPKDDEEKAAARRQASSRAGAIANRYWHHVPNEHVETKVRLRPEGNFGVYATHHGPMTDEARAKLSARRAPRNQQTPSAAPVEAPVGATAADRVRAAAKKQG